MMMMILLIIIMTYYYNWNKRQISDSQICTRWK